MTLINLITSGRLVLKHSKKPGFILTFIDNKLQCELYYKQLGFETMAAFVSFYNYYSPNPV